MSFQEAQRLYDMQCDDNLTVDDIDEEENAQEEPNDEEVYRAEKAFREMGKAI